MTENPSAFPILEGLEDMSRNWGGAPARQRAVTSGGMTLRDWFATHAPEPTETQMQNQRSYDRGRNPHNDSYKPPLRSDNQIRAQLAYQYADAMLSARQETRHGE